MASYSLSFTAPPPGLSNDEEVELDQVLGPLHAPIDAKEELVAAFAAGMRRLERRRTREELLAAEHEAQEQLNSHRAYLRRTLGDTFLRKADRMVKGSSSRTLIKAGRPSSKGSMEAPPAAAEHAVALQAAHSSKALRQRAYQQLSILSLGSKQPEFASLSQENGMDASESIKAGRHVNAQPPAPRLFIDVHVRGGGLLQRPFWECANPQDGATADHDGNIGAAEFRVCGHSTTEDIEAILEVDASDAAH